MFQLAPKAIQREVATVAIRAYAAASYRYYVLDDPTMEDADFDELCHWLSDNFEWVKPFDISGYLEMEALDAGTGFNIAAKVCGQTKDYADGLKKTITKVKVKVTAGKVVVAPATNNVDDLC